MMVKNWLSSSCTMGGSDEVYVWDILLSVPCIYESGRLVILDSKIQVKPRCYTCNKEKQMNGILTL